MEEKGALAAQKTGGRKQRRKEERFLANASTSSRQTEIRQTLDDENLSSEVDGNIGSKIFQDYERGHHNIKDCASLGDLV